MLMTKHNNVGQNFGFLLFMCFWIFNNIRLIKNNNVKTFKVEKKKQTIFNSSQQKAHNQAQSQNIGSIDAWTCCNAYA